MEDVVSDGRRMRQVCLLTTPSPGDEVPRLQPAGCERGVLLAVVPLDGAGAAPLGSRTARGGAGRGRAGGGPLTPEKDTPRCSRPPARAGFRPPVHSSARHFQRPSAPCRTRLPPP